MKGLLVDVLRPAHGADCTNGGVTSRVTSAVLVDAQRLPEIFDATERTPALVVMWDKRYLGGYIYAVPADLVGKRPMFGGNFVYTSDSRFRDVSGSGAPIPVHDRVESYT